MRNREIEIKRASWVGIIGNAILSLLKIIVGLFTGSLAVVADGIDSSSDIITSIITLITAKILTKPPDKKYPYGYDKADTIATKLLAFIIFFAGAQLFIASVKRLLEGGSTQIPGKLAIYITMVSIIGKLILSIHQLRAGKKTNSSMLIANSKNMMNDVVISGSVLTGLFFIYVLQLPILDTITALLVSLWVIRSAYRIFRETSLELMDGTKDCSVYEKIFNAIERVEGACNPHRVRVRHIGHKVMIAIDIEVDGSLTLYQAHEIAHRVEEQIKLMIDSVFDVTIHIEPLGDAMEEKALGIAKSNL
jgi:cation diffusion facilitator family transporter